MPKNLLIVESPAKARTIRKYLGSKFKIMASVGHIKDLPVKKLGVDLDNDFRPEYVPIKGKGKILQALKKAGEESEAIYLAPDPDREGEAIAWHIAQEMKNGEYKIYRVLFNELTERGIREAVASPQSLNQAKFEAQQARRILDRLVGYQISPLLWTRVKRGLSAGRVQSVTVKMICDREREIHSFESREYWSLTAHLAAKEPPQFKAGLSAYDGKKIELENEAQAGKIAKEVKEQPFRVSKVSRKKKRKNPPPPFTTSLLQQEAHRKLGFSAKKTMSVAQALYEGVELGEQGQIGLITYMRTDSFRLSTDAVSEARGLIVKAFGPEYLPDRPNRFKSRKGAQEAHEAIRPTSAQYDPDMVSPYLSRDQNALYALIWKRFVACQMNPAIMDQTLAEIQAGKATFRASGSIVVFKGFTVLYEEGREDSAPRKDKDIQLPLLRKGLTLQLLELEQAQHFTQPPPRFTEATLIKALEENGIGRPSTYAAILANISGKEYVSIQKKRFRPTELGFLVTDLLVKSFPNILDTAFTARMESNLDRIERGEIKWTRVLSRFYQPFRKDLERAQGEMKGEVFTGLTCPECDHPLAIKSGKNGLFLACTGYPKCRYTANFSRDEKGKIVPMTASPEGISAGTCEICGRDMVLKSGKFGSFLACSGYPDCKYTRALGPERETGFGKTIQGSVCKVCGAKMVVKVNRAGQKFMSCKNYPNCTHTEPMSTRIQCPNTRCEGLLVERISKKGRRFYACNQYPKCRFAMWDEPFDDVCARCGTSVMGIRRRKGSGPVLVCRKKGCGFTKPLPPTLDDLQTDGPS